MRTYDNRPLFTSKRHGFLASFPSSTHSTFVAEIQFNNQFAGKPVSRFVSYRFFSYKNFP
jgi:hypothetical protein